MLGRSLDDVAQQFDEVYTRLTQIQRRLVAATRSGADDDAPNRELVEEGSTMIAAFNAAKSAMDVGRLPRHEMEAQALRARVLVTPLDEHLLLSAARSQGRHYAFPLLADAIVMADNESFWADLSVLSILSAPGHMGEARARWLARHLELDAQASVAALDERERQRLMHGLRHYAERLPAQASGRPARPTFPDDGRGAGEDVLRRWVDPLGSPTDPLRQAAWAAAMRPGWPEDAVAVMEFLVEFTHRHVLPMIVPEFDRILDTDLSHEDLIAALRAEERAYRDAWRGVEDDRDEAYLTCSWALGRDVIALQALQKARTQVALPSEEWRGKSPLALAREGARRCGEALACVDDDPTDLLTQLPPPQVASLR